MSGPFSLKEDPGDGSHLEKVRTKDVVCHSFKMNAGVNGAYKLPRKIIEEVVKYCKDPNVCIPVDAKYL